MGEDERLQEIVRHHFGTFPQELVLIPTFEDTLVYEIRFSNAKYILKTTRYEADESLNIAVEAQICTLVHAQGVPSPKVVLCDASRKHFSRIYFIMEKAQGISLSKAILPVAATKVLLHQLGYHLRVMHSIQLPEYGPLDRKYYAQSGQIRGQVPAWGAYLWDQAQMDLDYFQRSRLLGKIETSHLRRLLQKYETSIEKWSNNRLLHGDFTLEHIWVDSANCKIAAIIDFGDAMIGDLAWDFVGYDWENESALQWLLDGYASTNELRDSFAAQLAIYRVIYSMRILVWVHKKGLGGLSEFANNLHRRMREAWHEI